MSEASRTFDQLTFEDLPNATSSQGSGSGPEHCETPESPTTTKYGPVPAHANLSARQAKEMGLQTSGIYGQRSIGSFGNAAPERSLANRLRAVTDILGSTLFKLTWKRNHTPSGRSIFVLRASALPTSAKGCTGVQTPTTETHPNKTHKDRRDGGQPNLAWEAALFSPVPTPRTPTGGAESASRKQELGRHESGGGDLQAEAMLFSPVPTPMANKNTPQQRDDFTPTLANVAEQFSSVPTPSANEDAAGLHGAKMQKMLGNEAHLFAPVATPQAMDVRGDTREAHERTPEANKGGCSNLREQVQAFATDSGKTPNGSSAATESTGQLNPCYSRYLMGLPIEWEFAAFQASETLKARKSSSRSSTKANAAPTDSEDTETQSSCPSPKTS